jgi:hypothetical protein
LPIPRSSLPHPICWRAVTHSPASLCAYFNRRLSVYDLRAIDIELFLFVGDHAIKAVQAEGPNIRFVVFDLSFSSSQLSDETLVVIV